MVAGTGSLINIVAIGLGTSCGVLMGNRFKERTRDLITDVLGFVVIIAAADALASLWNTDFVLAVPQGWTVLTILIALLLGAISGSWLDLEARLESAGVFLKRTFNKSGKGRFLEGFMAASLIFAIGPLAILGSISDGMGTGIQQLVLKSVLDFFTSIAFASIFGWGVAASAIPVGIYQLAWTGVGLSLGNILSVYQVRALTATGGVLLLGIAFRLLKIKNIAVGNLLPALAFVPVIALLVHQFI